MTRGVPSVSVDLDASVAQARSRTYGALAQDFARPQEGLEAEYARLFVGPGRPVVHPYESVYRERRLMGDCTLAVRQRYSAEGLAPEGHLLPDHVAVELEFMAHLAEKEAEARELGEVDGAQGCLRQQESFLREHLGRWLPDFCMTLLAGEPHSFYANLAQRTWEHVGQDMAQVRAWLAAATKGSTVERESWTVAVGGKCTLCGLCVRACLRKALSLIRDAGEMRLLFEPGVCDGCAACEQWCPERAMTVERASSSDGGQVLLVSSVLAICPICGEPWLSARLLARIEELVAGDDGLRRVLTMCPTCKTSSSGLSLSRGDR